MEEYSEYRVKPSLAVQVMGPGTNPIVASIYSAAASYRLNIIVAINTLI